MADLVLDVGALADLLSQYFQAEDRTRPLFEPSRFLSSEIARQINRIVRDDGRYIVAASAMAFVELVRKWDEIVDQRFEPYQLAAFLQDPPDWFSLEPVDEDLIPLFGQVPPEVPMPDGSVQTLEWPDVIHAATALSREEADLITSDGRLLQVMALQA
ncbi:MAG: hypothetical protein Kow0063_41780 [Anaerolineae bacterium]